MKTGKVIIATIAITIFNAAAGALTCGGFFNWVYKLEPVNVWKPMEAPGALFYTGSIILNFLFVLIYAMLHKGIPAANKFGKGLVYGLCVWALGMLPGMFSTCMFMTVAPTVIIYWLIMYLILDPIKGMITAAIYGE